MKILKPLFIFAILVFSIACHSLNLDDQKRQSGASQITIDLQPFSDISNEESNYVYHEIKKVCPLVDLKETISLPPSAFYAKKNRYRADTIIQYLSGHTGDKHVTIGITNKDISTNKGNILDWGVMGLGFCPGNACVVSSFRLSKIERLAQLFKVCIHEFGHTQGLPHCPVSHCFMRDAEGHNTTNEETGFCLKCKAV